MIYYRAHAFLLELFLHLTMNKYLHILETKQFSKFEQAIWRFRPGNISKIKTSLPVPAFQILTNWAIHPLYNSTYSPQYIYLFLHLMTFSSISYIVAPSHLF